MERCTSCGVGVGERYTPGCVECNESRAALYAMTGDYRYLFPWHYAHFCSAYNLEA